MRSTRPPIVPWQLTLAILKPDCVKVPAAHAVCVFFNVLGSHFIIWLANIQHLWNVEPIQAIRESMLHEGFYVLKWRRVRLSADDAGIFYQDHREKFFYGRLVTYMSR
jgi:nucleoside diphosphate kinase